MSVFIYWSSHNDWRTGSSVSDAYSVVGSILAGDSIHVYADCRWLQQSRDHIIDITFMQQYFYMHIYK